MSDKGQSTIITVAELIVILKTMPEDYEVMVDRGAAYDSAKSVDRNDTLKYVFISSEK
jgi:hypothetical protein